MPEWSKGADLRSAGYLAAWVRTPLQAFLIFKNIKNYLTVSRGQHRAITPAKKIIPAINRIATNSVIFLF
jgi:hypothetical protein